MNAVVWQTLKKHRAAFIILVIFTMMSTSLITGNTYLEGKLLDSLVYSRNPRAPICAVLWLNAGL